MIGRRPLKRTCSILLIFGGDEHVESGDGNRPGGLVVQYVSHHNIRSG